MCLMVCLRRRSLKVTLCDSFLNERVEFFLVEGYEGACVWFRGSWGAYVAIVKTMVFDGKIPKLLTLLGLAFFPVSLWFEAIIIGHFNHGLFLLPHPWSDLFFLVEPSFITHFTCFHPIFYQLFLPRLRLLHQFGHLISLLLLGALNSWVDSLFVCLIEQVEFFLFHHPSQLLWVKEEIQEYILRSCCSANWWSSSHLPVSPTIRLSLTSITYYNPDKANKMEAAYEDPPPRASPVRPSRSHFRPTRDG